MHSDDGSLHRKDSGQKSSLPARSTQTDVDEGHVPDAEGDGGIGAGGRDIEVSAVHSIATLSDWYGITEQEAQLALAYVETGVLKTAAKTAGLGYRVAKELTYSNTGFQLALNELFNTLVSRDKIKARAVIKTMMETADSENIKLKSAIHLWDRAEGEPVKRVLEQKEVNITMDQTAAMIVRLSQELGITPPVAEVIDVEVKNVEGEGEATTGIGESVPERPKVQPSVAVQSGSVDGADEEAT